MLLTLLIISGVFSKLSNKNTFLDDVTLKEDSSSKSGMFAIMVENDDGEYEEYTDSNVWPTGMIFNEENSGCVDASGNTVSTTISYNNGYVSISTNDTVYCYLYFDIYELNCVDEGVTSLSECILRSENNFQTEEDAVIYVKSKGTPTFSSTAIDDEGLYYAEDDYGDSYYFRGAVTDNYVYFAGYYWRIIRINGDGSIRMIYAGIDVNDTSDDQIGTSKFNEIGTDPTYVGYKYGTTSNTPVFQENVTNYTNFISGYTYYFGTNYEEVGDGTFKLSGTLINGTFEELFGSGATYENDIANYYTCVDANCTLLLRLDTYNSAISANVYYISYASENYENTLTNEYNSTIKQAVDKWYEENIKDKYDNEKNHLLSDYLADSAFCGDRSVYSGNGYQLTTTTNYGSYGRISKYSPMLYCKNLSDSYSVSNSNLDYPIGLITIDEVVLAGGKHNGINTSYYLYTGEVYWTMSPCYFNAPHGSAGVCTVFSSGYINYFATVHSLGVRPVINLSSSVILTSGDGTMNSPYEVSLQ